jgi:CHAT domain-containing protein/Tfp pilus assembly protein PilF
MRRTNIAVAGWNRLTMLIGMVAILAFSQSSPSVENNSEEEQIIAWGDSLRGIEQYSLALESYQSALTLFQSENNRSGIAKALRGIGTVYYYQGNYDSAMGYWEKALQIYYEIGDTKGEGKILNNYGLVYSNLSNFNQAIKYFHQSLSIAHEQNNLTEEGIAAQNLGNVYLKLSNYPDALMNYQQSLKIFRDLGNRQYEVIALMSIGSVYLYLCDYLKASDYYHNSYETAKNLGNCTTKAETMNNLGIVSKNLQEYDKALDYYQQSLLLFQELGNRNEEGNVLSNIGVIYSELQDYQNALKYYKKSLLVFRNSGEKLEECSNLFNIGRIYYNLGEYQIGLDSISKGVNLAEKLGADYYIQSGYLGLGDGYLALGRTSIAQTCYTKAIATIEKIRGKLNVESQKNSYASGVFSAYEKIVNLLLADNQIPQAFDYVERGRARSFLDILGGEAPVRKSIHAEFLPLEKNNKEYEPELQSVSNQQPLMLSEVQSLLNPETTLLEYFLTKDKAMIWVVTNKNVNAAEIELPADSLRCLVKAFRETIQWRGSTDFLSCELYKALLKPVLDKVKTERLIIVPHGILHYLPFQALKDQNGTYLFEQYLISYLPSASVMKYLPQRKNGVSTGKLLALGNPSTDNIDYNSLEFSEAEVDGIGKVIPNSKIYIGNLASESLFRRQAPEYDMLHLACHAELNSSYPMYSGLLLAPGEGNDGKLEVYEIFSLKLHAHLVVLSSCQTGMGKLTTGDELIGLSRAFICAGTQSLVSSLWEVNDNSTGYYMENFYQNLQNHDELESLQMAQSSTKEKYKDIYYWAPFVLIGGIK